MTQRNGGRAIRVLLAAASAVRRAGLEALVKDTRALKLVGSFQNLRSITQRATDLQPDVALIDLEQEVPLLSVSEGGFATVVLIDHPSSDWTAQILRSGVKSILSRDAGMD